VAHVNNLFCLRSDLHSILKTCYTHEYSNWRGLWGNATVLGWAAVNNQLAPEAWILFLIIFCWTPPHFWALALYRREEYAKVGIPMLPVTHGEKFTLLHIILYTIILAIVTLMPFSVGMSGLIYLFFATILNAIFLYYVVVLYRNYSDKLSKKVFNYSILYLSLIFAAFLVDHYYKFIFV